MEVHSPPTPASRAQKLSPTFTFQSSVLSMQVYLTHNPTYTRGLNSWDRPPSHCMIRPHAPEVNLLFNTLQPSMLQRQFFGVRGKQGLLRDGILQPMNSMVGYKHVACHELRVPRLSCGCTIGRAIASLPSCVAWTSSIGLWPLPRSLYHNASNEERGHTATGHVRQVDFQREPHNQPVGTLSAPAH